MRHIIGLRLLSLCLVSAAMLPAQTYLSFNLTDGYNPSGTPIQTADGALFGVAAHGGMENSGTIYTVSSKGLAPFHIFNCSSDNCPEGTAEADLVQAADGSIYGTALSGGAHGRGTIYRITPDGAFTVIHNLTFLEGGGVVGSLIQAANRDFYGVTEAGGINDSGTIFRMASDGTVTPLYNFCANSGCSPAQLPQGGLAQAANGDFYGLVNGGSNTSAIYRFTSAGQYATIYTFCEKSDCPDGNAPQRALIEAADGNLYGVSNGAGKLHNQSVIFRVSPDDTVTVVHTFGQNFGETLQLIAGSDGNLYGATSAKTIYRITLDGSVTGLYAISPSLGEFGYVSGLGQYTGGPLFMVTWQGGLSGFGAILSLNIGLPPFVKAQPGSAHAGSPVTITGTHLTGATAVTFNGMPAAFRIISDYAIAAEVPAGTSGGTIQVVTPEGTVSTDVAFHVL